MPMPWLQQQAFLPESAASARAKPDEETPAEPVSILTLVMKPSTGRQGRVFLNQHGCMDFVFAPVEGGTCSQAAAEAFPGVSS